MKKEKSCGCVVFDELNRVLLVKMNMGHWSFPKGHVEENETEEETALRETLEETHIKCNIIKGFREVSTYSPYDGVMKDVIFFVGKTTNTEIIRQVEEINTAIFIEIDKAKELITFDNDLNIFEKAVKFIKNL
ncbi:NUDIX domain-containing protein [Candidatus Izemoplasma sp. B36]|uniref:NUDIX domain-containing protein n=1 Tax=Candidatus Izemoplasma sp. B36 TaxID=3242468 RepID=UPI00355849A1